MLICPQCEFENPNQNKFCEKCGTSLTHKNCHQCGAQVYLSVQKCHNCGADIAQVWKAIIMTQAEALLPNSPEINPKEMGQEEVISGASPLAKDSADSATDIITEEPEEILESAKSSEEKIEVGLQPAAEVQSEDTLPETITETDHQYQKLEELDNSESITPDILSPMSEAANTENKLSSNPNDDLENSSTASEKYLDSQKRYQLLETIPPKNQSETVVVQVLDCNPLEQTPLKAWLRNNSGNFRPPTYSSQEKELSGYQNQENQFPTSNQQGETTEIEALIIPTIAQPYLALYSQQPQHFPTIQDSWRSQNKEILLVADYSSLPLLVNLWSSEHLSQLQILSWLQQMTELWVTLAPWNCCQSILEDENLRVNQTDNNYIKLQRLYSKPGETQNLQDLMKFWQSLFEQSQRTQFGWVTALMQDWRDGKIQTIEQLRSYLMTTEDNLQPQPPPTSAPTVLQTDDASPKIVENIETQDTELLPIQLVNLESAGKSDVGSQRDHNEDSFGIQTQIENQETPTERIIQAKGLYVLCDGMGGHDSGEIASQVAVDTIKQYFKVESSWSVGLPSEEIIREAVIQANKVIYEINQQEVRSGSSRMGTTLVMAMVYDTKVAVAHVGDSRLYRLSHQGGLEQITLDHEVGQREINRGVEPEIAYGRPDAYQLTQALGPRDENFVRPDVKFFELDEDSLIILASDGLTDNEFLENNWKNLLEPLLSKQANLEFGVNQLINLANQYNGHDNITAIVIRALVKPQKN
ncbi:MAG: serine/threonine phosphatase [Okeania sp. SIO2C9]|uniref:serine/threonine phosphatase n=1 Tax=Okeania sp. SIO2C9 TaxID=2607791 RepID=UPI0013BF5814|nr:serine/threonine phosphatase [Okeania sp. SIO2C9]NEQ77326.1 serine/threonine phosphatase [Okeania sp. SIO2C9]